MAYPKRLLAVFIAVKKSIPKWSTIIEPGTAMSDILRIAQGDGDLTLIQNNVVADTIKKVVLNMKNYVL